jgi:hypothetical protein
LLLTLAAFLSGARAGRARAGGKIERIRKKVRDSDEDDGTKDRERRDRDKGKEEREQERKGLFDAEEAWKEGEEEDEDRHELGDEACALLLAPAVRLTLQVLTSPLWAPALLIGDEPGFPGRPYRFASYPYAGGAAGYHLAAEQASPRAEAPSWPFGPRSQWQAVEGRRYGCRATYTFEVHADDILAHRAELIARTCQRLNLDLSFTDYAEAAGGGTDHMQTYEAHATYSLAVSERTHLAAGVGFRGLSWEGGEGRGGLDFRYEAEFFPVKPLHLHFIAEAGWVGGAGAWELEARAGALCKRAQFFVGYRHFRIAGEDLAGPVFGLSLWF